MSSGKRQRGWIEPLPSGALRPTIYAGVDPITGRRYDLRKVIPTDHPDKEAEAERVLSQFRAQIAEKRHPRTNASVDTLMEKYLAGLDAESSTVDRYADLARLHISPLIGSVPVARIDPEVVDSLLSEARRCRIHCKNSKGLVDHRTTRPHDCDDRCVPHHCHGLDKWTVRKIYWLCSGAFEKARRTYKWITYNPFEDVDPPAAPPSNPNPPTTREAATIVNEAWKSPDWGMLVWLAMITGARRGELCALRWRHIDLHGDVLRIESAIGTADGVPYAKDTKSHQARKLVLDDTSMALLRAYRSTVEAIAAAADATISGDSFLFAPVPDFSRPLMPGSISDRYARLVRRLGIRTSIHKLRHYSATELIAAGVDVRTVAGRLGHSGGGVTTLKTYAAFVSEADQRAAKALIGRVPRPPVDIDPTASLRPTTGAGDRPIPRGPYDRVAEDLRGAIRSGLLRPGDTLPPMAVLAERYQLAVSTVHRAIQLLKDDELVRVSRGRPATVTEDAAERVRPTNRTTNIPDEGSEENRSE